MEIKKFNLNNMKIKIIGSFPKRGISLNKYSMINSLFLILKKKN